MADVTALLSSSLDLSHPPEFSKDIARELAALISDPGNLTAGQRANAIVDALEDEWLEVVQDSIRRSQTPSTELETGSLVVLGNPPWTRILASDDLSTRPYRSDMRPENRSAFRLYRNEASWPRIVIDWSLDGVLAPLLRSLRVVATCHPAEHKRQYLYPTTTSTHNPREEVCFPVTPSAPDEHNALVRRIVDEAMHAAQIVVLPELAVTEDLAAELQTMIDARDDVLLVAGSAHVEVSGVRCNRARLLMPQLHKPIAVHDKFIPFQPRAAPREGIDYDPQGLIKVYMSGPWRIALVICRDFVERDVATCLAEIGVNLLLVPAMSETADIFVNNAATMLAGSQALVVVANDPGLWPQGPAIDEEGLETRGVERVVVARPLRDHELAHIARPAKTKPPSAPPGWYELALDASEPRWHPV